MDNLHNTQPDTDAGAQSELEEAARRGEQTEPLSLEDAFKRLAFVACQDERGLLLDCAAEASEINRTRAAFAQVRGVLNELEADFESAADEHRDYLKAELFALETRGRN